MNNLIKSLISISMLFAQSTHAFTTLETRPVAIKTIKENGVGATYKYMFGDGGMREMRVTGFQENPKGDGLLVTMERSGNKVQVNFVDDSISFTPVSDSATAQSELPATEGTAPAAVTDTTGTQQGTPVSSGTGISTGVGAGILAGLQTGIIEGSGFAKQIEEAYARINTLQQQMASDLNKVQEIRISLINKAVLINYKSDPTNLFASLGNREEIKALLNKATIAARGAGSSEGKINWISSDEQFLAKAQGIDEKVSTAPTPDDISKTYKKIAKSALIEADQSSYMGDRDQADAYLSVATSAADVLVGLDPFTGTVRSLYEAVTGVNMVTEQELTRTERIFAVLGTVTGGVGTKGPKVIKAINKISKSIAPKGTATLEHVTEFINKATNFLENVPGARKINIVSDKDPKWGFTKTHLNKHFFDSPRYALPIIDPKGNADIWLKNLADLMQRPVTSTLPNGALNIIGTFPKNDGSGVFELGVRLWPNTDGTFDFITVLTKQPK